MFTAIMIWNLLYQHPKAEFKIVGSHPIVQPLITPSSVSFPIVPQTPVVTSVTQTPQAPQIEPYYPKSDIPVETPSDKPWIGQPYDPTQ